MKKTVLASSIAAAVFGLGVAGVANAQFDVNAKGIGQMLVVPYYTVQDNNNTLINLVNTDTVNGKAIKIRFRSAANSDDVFDFQLFMSPGDVWAVNVSKGADGLPVLNLGDTSCTKPATVAGVPFVTSRLNSAWSAADKANNTREGYVEIINMADVPPLQLTGDVATAATLAANPLFAAIKHDAKRAVTCRAATPPAAWTNLDDLEVLTVNSPAQVSTVSNPTVYSLTVASPAADATSNSTTGQTRSVVTAALRGMTNATGGLMANWTIINTVGAAAWTGEAVAIQDPSHSLYVNYFSQTDAPLSSAPGSASVGKDAAALVGEYEDRRTADPLFRRTAVWTWNNTNQRYEVARTGSTNDFLVTPAVAPLRFDLPDLSTPVRSYATGVGTSYNAREQARQLSSLLATTNFINEYITETGIGAKTDWVFSMPTRRYNVVMNYAGVSTGVDGRRWVDLGSQSFEYNETTSAGVFPGSGSFVAADLATTDETKFPYFKNSNTSVNALSQICVKGITRSAYDREEQIETALLQTVISPNVGSAPELFCGEVSVLSVNNDTGSTSTGALKAQVAIKDLAASYSNGWMSLNLGTTGFPVVGFAAVKANGAANGQTYGATWNHRTK